MSGLVHCTTGMVDEKTMHNDSIHSMSDLGGEICGQGGGVLGGIERNGEV